AATAAASRDANRGPAGGTCTNVNRGRIPFTASNTDAWTIAAMRVPGGPGVCATVCASISVVFQSVTASAEAALGAASAPSASRSSADVVFMDNVFLLRPWAGDPALGDGGARPSSAALATLKDGRAVAHRREAAGRTHHTARQLGGLRTPAEQEVGEWDDADGVDQRDRGTPPPLRPANVGRRA